MSFNTLMCAIILSILHSTLGLLFEIFMNIFSSGNINIKIERSCLIIAVHIQIYINQKLINVNA